MNSALQVLSTVFVIDLTSVLGVAGLLLLLQRRKPGESNARFPLRPVIAGLIFLGIASLMIYGGLWLALRSIRD